MLLELTLVVVIVFRESAVLIGLRDSVVVVGLLESVVVVVVVVVVGDSVVLVLPLLPANVFAFDCTDASTETSAFDLFLVGSSKL